VHVRSVVDDPAAETPTPAGQERHEAHAWLPAMALNVPDSQGLQTRFDDAVGALDSYQPLPHDALTGAQTSALSIAENVEPALHGVHLRSATLEPGADMPSPTGHFFHAAQAYRPGEEVNVPEPHTSQVRSAPAVASAEVRVPATHAALTDSHSAPLL
jgi:hypothetical protein